MTKDVTTRLVELLDAIDAQMEKGSAQMEGFDWPAISVAHEEIVRLRAAHEPGDDWKVRVHESSDAMWLRVFGPAGQCAAFDVPKDSVRAEVLRQYGLRPENRPAEGA